MRNLVVTTMFVLAAVSMAGAQTAQSRGAVQHLRAGQDALQSERWEEAEREFKQAIELDPLLDLAHYGLGQTYMATKRYVEAIKAFTGARDAFHKAAGDQITNSVEWEQRLEDQIRSLRDTRRGLESGRLRSSGTNVTTKMGEIDDQIRQLEAMRRKDQTSAPVTPAYISLALGSAYFRTSAFPDAEREWRAALEANPKLGEAHNNLAVVLMLTGRFDEAEQEIDLAEKNGHKVSDQFKADLKARKAAKG